MPYFSSFMISISWSIVSKHLLQCLSRYIPHQLTPHTWSLFQRRFICYNGRPRFGVLIIALMCNNPGGFLKYPIRPFIVRYSKVSNQRVWAVIVSGRSEIWHAVMGWLYRAHFSVILDNANWDNGLGDVAVIFNFCQVSYPGHYLWKCRRVNATIPHLWIVHIGSGNGLVPSASHDWSWLKIIAAPWRH